MIPTVEMIEAGWKAGLGLNKRQVERILVAALAAMPGPAETLESYFARQIEWSRQTFGPAFRTKGVIEHIRKELNEIEQAPHDLSEWIDVVILAMDGFWRHGGEACNLLPALVAKQRKNMARTWPDWRDMSEDSAIEHDRSGEDHAITPAPELASENERLREALHELDEYLRYNTALSDDPGVERIFAKAFSTSALERT